MIATRATWFLVVTAERRREVEVEEAFGESDSRRAEEEREKEGFDESDSRRARENCPSSIARVATVASFAMDGSISLSCSRVNVFAWIDSGA